MGLEKECRQKADEMSLRQEEKKEEKNLVPRDIKIDQKKNFPKKIRIVKNSDFSEIFRKGKKLRGENFDVYMLKMQNYKEYLFGIAISKKNIRGAVERNRYKRIIREIYRNEKENFKKGQKTIIFVKRMLKKTNYEIIKSEILSLLLKSGNRNEMDIRNPDSNNKIL